MKHKGVVFVMETIDRIALILLIVGGINWGSIGLFGFDLVSAAFMPDSMVSKAIFTIVGLAAVYSITLLFKEREVEARQ